ncbi:hypothetical protein WQE_19624 [Paraburkholderia hospita]|uniref:Uncharacterized protein n=1 Tax=Paraburkholderia hospita TaxID=169430 RepID=A0AAN1JK25_9BURK|nr:hypothetical protein C2L64_39500 [Paraburkholderia hospita]EIM99349.1 hypothetical protein WQE_19624 [Paraburkholderia hospita]
MDSLEFVEQSNAREPCAATRFVQSDGAREARPARAMEGSNDQHGFADSIRAAERHASRDNDRRCACSDNCMGYANRACRAVG